MEADYKEASAQLILDVFLDKVINGAGRIECEYAMGRERTDSPLIWPQGGQWGRGRVSEPVIECKVLRKGGSLARTIRQGVRHTAAYMDRCGTELGHLLVFDQRPGRSWAERIFRQEQSRGEMSITVRGM